MEYKNIKNRENDEECKINHLNISQNFQNAENLLPEFSDSNFSCSCCSSSSSCSCGSFCLSNYLNHSDSSFSVSFNDSISATSSFASNFVSSVPSCCFSSSCTASAISPEMFSSLSHESSFSSTEEAEAFFFSPEAPLEFIDYTRATAFEQLVKCLAVIINQWNLSEIKAAYMQNFFHGNNPLSPEITLSKIFSFPFDFNRFKNEISNYYLRLSFFFKLPCYSREASPNYSLVHGKNEKNSASSSPEAIQSLPCAPLHQDSFSLLPPPYIQSFFQMHGLTETHISKQLNNSTIEEGKQKFKQNTIFSADNAFPTRAPILQRFFGISEYISLDVVWKNSKNEEEVASVEVDERTANMFLCALNLALSEIHLCIPIFVIINESKATCVGHCQFMNDFGRIVKKDSACNRSEAQIDCAEDIGGVDHWNFSSYFGDGHKIDEENLKKAKAEKTENETYVKKICTKNNEQAKGAHTNLLLQELKEVVYEMDMLNEKKNLQNFQVCYASYEVFDSHANNFRNLLDMYIEKCSIKEDTRKDIYASVRCTYFLTDLKKNFFRRKKTENFIICSPVKFIFSKLFIFCETYHSEEKTTEKNKKSYLKKLKYFLENDGENELFFCNFNNNEENDKKRNYFDIYNMIYVSFTSKFCSATSHPLYSISKPFVYSSSPLSSISFLDFLNVNELVHCKVYFEEEDMRHLPLTSKLKKLLKFLEEHFIRKSKGQKNVDHSKRNLPKSINVLADKQNISYEEFLFGGIDKEDEDKSCEKGIDFNLFTDNISENENFKNIYNLVEHLFSITTKNQISEQQNIKQNPFIFSKNNFSSHFNYSFSKNNIFSEVLAGCPYDTFLSLIALYVSELKTSEEVRIFYCILMKRIRNYFENLIFLPLLGDYAYGCLNMVNPLFSIIFQKFRAINLALQQKFINHVSRNKNYSSANVLLSFKNNIFENSRTNINSLKQFFALHSSSRNKHYNSMHKNGSYLESKERTGLAIQAQKEQRFIAKPLFNAAAVECSEYRKNENNSKNISNYSNFFCYERRDDQFHEQEKTTQNHDKFQSAKKFSEVQDPILPVLPIITYNTIHLIEEQFLYSMKTEEKQEQKEKETEVDQEYKVKSNMKLLKSLMQCFKHKNMHVEDFATFVHWYTKYFNGMPISMTDFIHSHKNYQNKFYEINLNEWKHVWQSVNSLPQPESAFSQTPFFSSEMEGEMALHYLESLSAFNFVEEIVRLFISLCLDFWLDLFLKFKVNIILEKLSFTYELIFSYLNSFLLEKSEETVFEKNHVNCNRINCNEVYEITSSLFFSEHARGTRKHKKTKCFTEELLKSFEMLEILSVKAENLMQKFGTENLNLINKLMNLKSRDEATLTNKHDKRCFIKLIKNYEENKKSSSTPHAHKSNQEQGGGAIHYVRSYTDDAKNLTYSQPSHSKGSPEKLIFCSFSNSSASSSVPSESRVSTSFSSPFSSISSLPQRQCFLPSTLSSFPHVNDKLTLFAPPYAMEYVFCTLPSVLEAPNYSDKPTNLSYYSKSSSPDSLIGGNHYPSRFYVFSSKHQFTAAITLLDSII